MKRGETRWNSHVMRKTGVSSPTVATVVRGLTSVMPEVRTLVEEGLAAGSPISQRAEVGTGSSSPRRAPVSGRDSTSGSTDVLRPSRARDRVTMVEVNPAPGRVTAGVGSVSRGAETELDSPDSLLRPTLRLGSASMAIVSGLTNRVSHSWGGKPEQATEVEGA